MSIWLLLQMLIIVVLHLSFGNTKLYNCISLPPQKDTCFYTVIQLYSYFFASHIHTKC